jgi:hypothetical protein
MLLPLLLHLDCTTQPSAELAPLQPLLANGMMRAWAFDVQLLMLLLLLPCIIAALDAGQESYVALVLWRVLVRLPGTADRPAHASEDCSKGARAQVAVDGSGAADALAAPVSMATAVFERA